MKFAVIGGTGRIGSRLVENLNAAGSPRVLNSVSARPGAAIVWAVGESGTSGSFNPLVLHNG
jgi:nucleoside-diphosphate-sugar epimerase